MIDADELHALWHASMSWSYRKDVEWYAPEAAMEFVRPIWEAQAFVLLLVKHRAITLRRVADYDRLVARLLASRAGH